MKETLLLFTKTGGWKNRLMCLKTGWSSVDIILPQQKGEPVFIAGLDAQMGVVAKIPLANRVVKADTVGMITFPQFSAEPIIDAILSQTGKTFDWRWFIPNGLNRKRKNTDTWFPSELFRWAFLQAGHPIFPESFQKVSIQDFWSLNMQAWVLARKEIIKKNNRILYTGEKTV